MLHEPWKPLTIGEPSAWSSFVAANLPLIETAVRRTLLSAGAAQETSDVVQDVFVRLCQNDYKLLRRFDPARGSESAWLALVARGIAIEYLRRKNQSVTSLEVDSLPAPPPQANDPVELPPGLLTGRQILVLRLLFDQDLTPEEAGQALGISPQTVRSTKHNALKLLRQYLGATKK